MFKKLFGKADSTRRGAASTDYMPWELVQHRRARRNCRGALEQLLPQGSVVVLETTSFDPEVAETPASVRSFRLESRFEWESCGRVEDVGNGLARQPLLKGSASFLVTTLSPAAGVRPPVCVCRQRSPVGMDGRFRRSPSSQPVSAGSNGGGVLRDVKSRHQPNGPGEEMTARARVLSCDRAAGSLTDRFILSFVSMRWPARSRKVAHAHQIVGDDAEPDPAVHAVGAMVATAAQAMTSFEHTDAAFAADAPALPATEPSLPFMRAPRRRLRAAAAARRRGARRGRPPPVRWSPS